MPRKTIPDNLTTIGIDMGKTTYHMIGLDAGGTIVLREKISRTRICALAVPATAHPHGAKSKRHYGKAYRTRHRKRMYRRYGRYRDHRTGTCPVQPSPYFQDYPYWAACAFTPKLLR